MLTVPTHNSHTQNSRTYRNSHTLSALTNIYWSFQNMRPKIFTRLDFFLILILIKGAKWNQGEKGKILRLWIWWYSFPQNLYNGLLSSQRPAVSVGVKCSIFSTSVIKQKHFFMIPAGQKTWLSPSFYVYGKLIVKISLWSLFSTINQEKDDTLKNFT